MRSRTSAGASKTQPQPPSRSPKNSQSLRVTNADHSERDRYFVAKRDRPPTHPLPQEKLYRCGQGVILGNLRCRYLHQTCMRTAAI
jgi:hypothetical protein